LRLISFPERVPAAAANNTVPHACLETQLASRSMMSNITIAALKVGPWQQPVEALRYRRCNCGAGTKFLFPRCFSSGLAEGSLNSSTNLRVTDTEQLTNAPEHKPTQRRHIKDPQIA